MSTQYGIEWPTGVVTPYNDFELAIAFLQRGKDWPTTRCNKLKQREVTTTEWEDSSRER